jgi:hypothetical protein
MSAMAAEHDDMCSQTLFLFFCMQDGAGPPYGLLQGTMSQLKTAPPKEGTTLIKYVANTVSYRPFELVSWCYY